MSQSYTSFVISYAAFKAQRRASSANEGRVNIIDQDGRPALPRPVIASEEHPSTDAVVTLDDAPAPLAASRPARTDQRDSQAADECGLHPVEVATAPMHVSCTVLVVACTRLTPQLDGLLSAPHRPQRQWRLRAINPEAATFLPMTGSTFSCRPEEVRLVWPGRYPPCLEPRMAG